MPRRVSLGLTLLACSIAAVAGPGHADAKQRVLKAASYPGMSTFSCRTKPIPIHPGQNLNDIGITTTCPNATKLSGPGDASVFAPGSKTKGFITRFEPSMVEIKPSGKLVTPSVWDLHLHHVVWIQPGGGPTFASGEEKTIASLPKGYGLEVQGGANWGINQMIHNLNASDGREVYITWEIDWVPQASPPRTDIADANIRWLDVAGAPQIYPVFDAERGFDTDGDGRYTFPDEVPTNPAAPGFEEREKISDQRQWNVPASGATLLFGAGHLHPGGLKVDLRVARDGPDEGDVPGDTAEEIKHLFRSNARYYEPAGAVSWDVAMEATRRSWRISLEPGDRVFVNVTYDVRRASWYESMGILPLAWTSADDPKARDPFTQAAEVRAMYERGGILTHGRLKENIDAEAREDLGLADPRELRSSGPVPADGIGIRSFVFLQGGFSVVEGFPTSLMRPPAIDPGETVTFTNQDAQPGQPQTEQAWHSITSCRAPCNKGSGIGYPLANGPIKFDSGQLGYGYGTSKEVTTGTDTYTTPPLPLGRKAGKRGSTYTYFCRIHPYMRGSIRVK
jgi:plastocyanin